ncbi:MAG TPA: hypothetical protein GXZ64_07810 [Clostridiaceae bacterium]|jgi:hypothetical protein|nr:hypothetical protein [Clostridiaceae bacterium]
MSHIDLKKIGILLPDGSINKTKINYLAGEITLPFADMVWVSTNRDPETITRLTQLFLDMRTLKKSTLFFSLIYTLFALLGLQTPDSVLPLLQNREALEYFLYSFINDFGEIMQEKFDDGRMAQMAKMGDYETSI